MFLQAKEKMDILLCGFFTSQTGVSSRDVQRSRSRHHLDIPQHQINSDCFSIIRLCKSSHLNSCAFFLIWLPEMSNLCVYWKVNNCLAVSGRTVLSHSFILTAFPVCQKQNVPAAELVSDYLAAACQQHKSPFIIAPQSNLMTNVLLLIYHVWTYIHSYINYYYYYYLLRGNGPLIQQHSQDYHSKFITAIMDADTFLVWLALNSTWSSHLITVVAVLVLLNTS